MPYIDLNAIKKQARIDTSDDKKSKTDEEKYKQEHEAEKKKAQDEVDSVLNSGVYERDNLSSLGIKRQSSVVIPDKFPSKIASDDDSGADSDDADTHEEPKQPDIQINEDDHFASISSGDLDFDINNDDIAMVAPDDIDGPVQSEDTSGNNTNLPVNVKTDTYSDEDEFYDDDNDIDSLDDYDNHEELVHKKSEAAKPAHSASAASREKGSQSKRARSVTKLRQTEADIKYSALRKVPTALVMHVKSLFPKATNIDDAVTAYIYRIERQHFEADAVPEKIREIADDYIGDDVNISSVQGVMLEEMGRLRSSVNKSINRLSAIELGIIYALFDRMGFRKKEQLTPGEIDFLEAGIGDLLMRLESQAAMNEQRRKEREGRPKR